MNPLCGLYKCQKWFVETIKPDGLHIKETVPFIEIECRTAAENKID